MQTLIEVINKKVFFVLAIFVVLISISLIFFSPEHFIYDEAHYYSNTELLRNSSNSLIFLKEMKGPVGPLPNYIQFVFGSIFNFNIRFLRFINLFLIIFTSIIPSIYFFNLNKKKKRRNYINVFIPIVVCFSLPFTWVISCMALTEAGSVFFTMVSLFLLSKYLNSNYKKNLYLFFSSFAISLASLGRQTLVVLSPVLFLYVIFFRNRYKLKEATTFLLLSLSLPTILFLIWGGIIPQDYHVVQYAESGTISIKGFILSVGYLGFSFIFICPSKIIRIVFSLKGALIFLLSIITNFFVSIDYYPMRSIINVLIRNEILIQSINLLFPIISLFMGLILFSVMFDRIFKSYKEIDVIEKISWIMIILIIISNLAITHQFSSRYLAVGLAPIIIIGTSLTRENNFQDRIGNILGIFLGILTLMSYYGTF